MRLDITEPSYGWNNVTHVHSGKLLAIKKGENGEKAVVDFPTCRGRRWKGLLSELEKTRHITVGDLVQVDIAPAMHNTQNAHCFLRL